MKILFYSTKDFEREYLFKANTGNFTIRMTELALSPDTAALAQGFDCISVFTGDVASAQVIEALHEYGVKFITARSAGYDNINLVKAKDKGMHVANVPAYSPYSIAEHALALMLALNRKLIIANDQVHHYNFKMNNLIGFDFNNKTVGVIGTGRIGSVFIKLIHGLGCRILGYDVKPNEELTKEYNIEYTDLDTLCRQSDVISLHTCLTPETKYMINKNRIALMKKGVMLINTSRGPCINTEDLLYYLQTGHVGYFGADVYEKERGIFFYDWSNKPLQDEMLKRLLSMPNVLITPHQAFGTREAIGNIAETTFHNIACWAANKNSENELVRVDFRSNSAAGTSDQTLLNIQQ